MSLVEIHKIVLKFSEWDQKEEQYLLCNGVYVPHLPQEVMITCDDHTITCDKCKERLKK